MPEEKITESRPVEPIKIAIIGTGDGSKMASGTEATTAGAHQPNLIIKVVTPVVAIAIRVANTYVVTLSGFLGAKLLPAGNDPILAAIQAADFYQMLLTGLSLAVAPAAVSLLKNLVTVLGGLEKKFPLSTGSV